MFGAAVCKIQARKCYAEPLQLVLECGGLCLAQLCAKYRLVSAFTISAESCFSQSQRSAVQLPLDRALALQKYDA